MAKAFLKYLLILCILLLSGYGHLSAQISKENTVGSTIKSLYGLEVASIHTTQKDQTLVVSSSSSSGTAKENHKKVVTAEYEIEEDDSVSFKRFLETNSYLTAIVYAFTFAYLFRCINKCFSITKHLSHFSSYRWHIVIQVFRI